MGEYKSRSNDPRITRGAKKDKYKYDMALEVALQPADTPERKRMKKDAQNYVRAFESRFQDEAFFRSGGSPYSAGGKGEFKDERFVDKNAANDNKKKAVTKRASKSGKSVSAIRNAAKLVSPFAAPKKKETMAPKPAVKRANAKPAPKATAKPTPKPKPTTFGRQAPRGTRKSK